MGKLPKQIKRKDLIKRFRELGWSGPHDGVRGRSGDHPQFMSTDEGNRVVKLPNPHRGDIGEALLKTVLAEARIPIGEWLGEPDRPLAIDLGKLVSRSERRGLAYQLECAAATAAPEVADILVGLAAAARGTGPLTADVTALNGSGRQAVADTLEALTLAEVAPAGRDKAALIATSAGWREWMRNL